MRYRPRSAKHIPTGIHRPKPEDNGTKAHIMQTRLGPFTHPSDPSSIEKQRSARSAFLGPPHLETPLACFCTVPYSQNRYMCYYVFFMCSSIVHTVVSNVSSWILTRSWLRTSCMSSCSPSAYCTGGGGKEDSRRMASSSSQHRSRLCSHFCFFFSPYNTDTHTFILKKKYVPISLSQFRIPGCTVRG